jgi:hypothetical protein
MFLTRSRRAILRHAAAGVVLIAGAGLALPAAAAMPSPKVFDSAGSVPVHGDPTGFVRDADGTASLIVVGRSGLDYLTRAHGHSRWTSRQVPGSALSGLSSARLVLSLDGRSVYLVVLAGHRLYVVKKPIGAPNFPKLGKPTARTGIGEPLSEVGLLSNAVALPAGRIAFLVAIGTAGVLHAFITRPGHLIVRWQLQLTDGQSTGGPVAAALARDPKTGDLIAVGYQNGRLLPILAIRWFPQSEPGEAFIVGHGRYGPAGQQVLQTVTSLAAMNGQFWVGLSQAAALPVGEGQGAPLGVAIAHCFVNAHPCSHPHRLPHSAQSGQDLLLTADAQRHRIQALYASRGGLLHQVLGAGGSWSSPDLVKPGRHDVPLFLVLTKGRSYRYLYVKDTP